LSNRSFSRVFRPRFHPFFLPCHFPSAVPRPVDPKTPEVRYLPQSGLVGSIFPCESFLEADCFSALLSNPPSPLLYLLCPAFRCLVEFTWSRAVFSFKLYRVLFRGLRARPCGRPVPPSFPLFLTPWTLLLDSLNGKRTPLPISLGFGTFFFFCPTGARFPYPKVLSCLPFSLVSPL